MTIEQAKNNIGQCVVYTPFKGYSKEMLEYGAITSVNDKLCICKIWQRYSFKSDKTQRFKILKR